MDVYFFDVHDGCLLTRDRIGAPLEDRDTAWVSAARILVDLAEDAGISKPADRSRMFVQIRDCSGAVGVVQMSFTPARVYSAAEGQ